MSNIEIITGNALVELEQLETGSVDLVIADPPYNLGKDYGNNHDVQGFDEIRGWLGSIFEEADSLDQKLEEYVKD